MKTRLVKLTLLLVTLAALPLVQGCYGDRVNVAAAWVPADLQGLALVGTGGATTAGGGGNAGGGSGGGYIP